MIRLAWRQHRVALFSWTGILLVLGVAFLTTALILRDLYPASELGLCSHSSSGAEVCGRSEGTAQDTLIRTMHGLAGALPYLPMLMGMFLAAPLMAREFEEGTARWAWTQGVSRQRWLAGKLVTVLTPTLLLTAVFQLGYQIWYGPLAEYFGAFEDPNRGFAMGPLVMPVMVLLAIALGLLVGMLVRHTTASVAVTMVSMIALSAVLNRLRPRYLEPVTARVSEAGSGLQVETWTTDTNGSPLSATEVLARVEATRPDGSGDMTEHYADAGIESWIAYHPDDRFWTLQAIETGGVVALAVACLSVVWLRLRGRRPARLTTSH